MRLIILLIIFQLRYVFIKGKVFNGNELYEEAIRNSLKDPFITPDTSKVVPGALVLFQQLDTLNGGYVTIASTTTDSNGRYIIEVPVGVKEKFKENNNLEDLLILGNYIINNSSVSKEIRLIDISGRVIGKRTLRPKERVSIGKLNDGVYFLKTNNNVYKIGSFGNKLVFYGSLINKSVKKDLVSLVKQSTNFDTTYRVIVASPDSSTSFTSYPWLLNNGNIPETTIVGGPLLYNKIRIDYVKDTLTPGGPYAVPLDTITITTDWLRDLGYVSVDPNYGGYPIWLPVDPEWLYLINEFENQLSQPYTIYIKYDNPPSQSQFASDSFEVAKVYGVDLPLQRMSVPTWYYRTGFPQIKKIDWVVVPDSIPWWTMSIYKGAGNFTIRENDTIHGDASHPWVLRSYMSVTGFYYWMIAQESKGDGETECYLLPRSIYNDVGNTADTITKWDGAVKKAFYILKYSAGMGLKSDNVYVLGYILEKEGTKRLIQGYAEP